MRPLHPTLILVMAMTVQTTASAAPELPACPASPNCVSSQSRDSHFIAPLAFAGPADAAFARLRETLGRRPDTTIVSADAATIRVEFRTTLGFVDDGLFVLDSPNSSILCRSAARVGYWDLGKNRRRLEEIRQQFTPAAAADQP